MFTKHTHVEYRDMLLALDTCNSRADTAAREYALRCPGRRGHPDAKENLSGVSVRHEM
jgi:hypothetical protein